MCGGEGGGGLGGSRLSKQWQDRTAEATVAYCRTARPGFGGLGI